MEVNYDIKHYLTKGTHKYDFKKANYMGLLNYLQKINWYLLFSQMNVDDKWLNFKKVLEHAISMRVPITKNRKKQNKCFLPKNIKEVINYEEKDNVKAL